MGIYCLECKGIGCKKAEPLLSGWVFIDGSGKPSSKGEKMNVGVHAAKSPTR